MKFENAKYQTDQYSSELYIEVMAKSMQTGAVMASYSTRRPVLAANQAPMYRYQAMTISGVRITVFDFAPFFQREHYDWIAREYYKAWREHRAINDCW